LMPGNGSAVFSLSRPNYHLWSLLWTSSFSLSKQKGLDSFFQMPGFLRFSAPPHPLKRWLN
jgi:hypothetical protein